ncbi:ALP1-like protein [Tanacetum coccineum]
MKCTFTIRQMAYGSILDALDEYMQMAATTARQSLVAFCTAVMEFYGEEFLRKSTYTNIEKFYARHDEKYGFTRMIGIIECTDPFILLEAIASQDLWIWHAFFGVSRMNNDMNVLCQFAISNDLKEGKAPDVPFVANDLTCKRGYYVTPPNWVAAEYRLRVLLHRSIAQDIYKNDYLKVV